MLPFRGFTALTPRIMSRSRKYEAMSSCSISNATRRNSALLGEEQEGRKLFLISRPLIFNTLSSTFLQLLDVISRMYPFLQRHIGGWRSWQALCKGQPVPSQEGFFLNITGPKRQTRFNRSYNQPIHFLVQKFNFISRLPTTSYEYNCNYIF